MKIISRFAAGVTTLGTVALGLVLASQPARAALIVDIQPVSICLDNGTSCGAVSFDAAALQAFWLAEAGITLNILASRNFNSTTFQTMDTLAEASSFVLSFVSPDPAGPIGFVPGPINVWFANSAGFPSSDIEVAVIAGNRSWVAANIDPQQQTTALAHALGHNLGLTHNANAFLDPSDLMSLFFRPISTVGLDQGQVDELLRVGLLSGLIRNVDTVPEPATMTLLGLGLAGLGFARRRKVA